MVRSRSRVVTLAIGNSLTVNGGGFDANSGLVSFLYSTTDVAVTTGGSSFADVTFGSDAVLNWYDTNWSHRSSISIASTTPGETVTDFPIYVNLADLGDDFWNNVRPRWGRYSGDDQ